METLFIPQQSTEWILKAKELYRIREMRRNMEKMEEELMGQLKVLSGNQSARGGGLRFELTERKGQINYKIIPELKEVNLEQYRCEPVYVWKLSLELPNDSN